MRMGVDLQAIQAPSCRNRGIGRYAKALLRALLVEAPSWEFVFYRRADLEFDSDPAFDERVAEWVDVDPDPLGKPDGTLQEIIQRNPQGLDWLLIPNPLVDRRTFAIPEPIPGGLRLVSIVYDLIPALYPKHYLPDARLWTEYHRDLRRLGAYDVLLCISEATRRDAHTLLGIPEHRLSNIGAAADPDFFRPATPEEEAAGFDARTLLDHGIDGPFFYYLGNVDWRKNALGLIDAFALLPEDVRESHRLVLTCQENAWFLDRLQRRIEHHALGQRVVLTGPATDAVVRSFYRRAELFLFPSLYEGFGLPILEALQCGAAVVAADNSSQPEVVGSAGVLAESGHAADWARKITGLIRDPDRIAVLRRGAIEQASLFSWEASARRLREAVERASRKSVRRRREPITLIPLPSRGDLGFDVQAAELFNDLCDTLNPLVFYDADRIDALPTLPLTACWHEKRLLGRVRSVIGAGPVLYLVDSLDALASLTDDLREHPGLVAFCNRQVADWPDLVRHQANTPMDPNTVAGIEDDLSRIIRLATALGCHSEWLHRQIVRLAGDDPTTPVHHVAPSTSRAQADFYHSLLRAS